MAALETVGSKDGLSTVHVRPSLNPDSACTRDRAARQKTGSASCSQTIVRNESSTCIQRLIGNRALTYPSWLLTRDVDDLRVLVVVSGKRERSPPRRKSSRLLQRNLLGGSFVIGPLARGRASWRRAGGPAQLLDRALTGRHVLYEAVRRPRPGLSSFNNLAIGTE